MLNGAALKTKDLTNDFGCRYLESAVGIPNAFPVWIKVQLSPKQKRKVILQITNPRPNADGVIHPTITLYHAERHIRNNRAYRMDEDGTPNPEGNWLTFFDDAPPRNGKVDVASLLLRMSKSPTPARVRELPPEMSNETGIDLWPVKPCYSGRSLDDYIKRSKIPS